MENLEQKPKEQISEKKICELMKKYKILAENTVECIWLLDLKNEKFKYISPAIMQLRGLTPEQAMKEKLSDSLTPESVQKVKESIIDRLSKYMQADNRHDVLGSIDEFQQYHKDGTIIDVEISTKYIYNEETDFVDVLGVSRNITQRKNLERRLTKEITDKNSLIRKLKNSETALAKLTEELIEKNKELSETVTKDKLTGIYNRYFFDKKIAEEIDRACRYNEKLSIIIFDIDRFKRINDTYGHDEGDKVIIKMIQTVKKMLRKSDIFARWGGEEFVVVMPNADLKKATAVAEKLRMSLEKVTYKKAGVVTASFGVAELTKNEEFKGWFKRVDKALYRAKNEGRNRVICDDQDADMLPVGLIRLEWNESFISGEKTIDEQHKSLFEIANNLMDKSFLNSAQENLKDTLEELIEQLRSHFEYEEAMLEKIRFHDNENHAEKHNLLLEKSIYLKEKFINREIKYLTFFTFVVEEVIVNHLIKEDTLFFAYI